MASKRPETREELQKREAIGVIRASRFVNIFAKQQDPITFETIEQMHHIIFNDAQPDIAGKLRSAMGTDVKKLHYHLPPPHQEVAHLVAELDSELAKNKKHSKRFPFRLLVLQGCMTKSGNTLNALYKQPLGFITGLCIFIRLLMGTDAPHVWPQIFYSNAMV